MLFNPQGREYILTCNFRITSIVMCFKCMLTNIYFNVKKNTLKYKCRFFFSQGLKVTAVFLRGTALAREGYGVLVLDGSGADATVSLPESDGMIISSGGENHRITADGALIHIHDQLNADLVTASREDFQTRISGGC